MTVPIVNHLLVGRTRGDGVRHASKSRRVPLCGSSSLSDYRSLDATDILVPAHGYVACHSCTLLHAYLLANIETYRAAYEASSIAMPTVRASILRDARYAVMGASNIHAPSRPEQEHAP